MDLIKVLAKECEIAPGQAQAAVQLLDEGCSVPFIARYRKEATGGLDDEVLRRLTERLSYLRGLEERRQQILSAIREQEKLTPELERQIAQADTLVTLEDLYRPYRPKRRTRALIAREKGLEELARRIRRSQLTVSPAEEAAAFLSQEKGVTSIEEALAGARDIIAEEISDDAALRAYVRSLTEQKGRLTAAAKDPQKPSVYETYYSYEEEVRRVPGHRILAMDRGEKEKVLSVKIAAPREEILRDLERRVVRGAQTEAAGEMLTAVRDAYDRLIAPSIENEIRGALTERAQEGAIGVFGKNLRQLLMQPPVAGHRVLGWDPAFRTGCKLAVVDETGKVLDTAVIYPTAPTTPAKQEAARRVLTELIRKYHITLFSVGNGTASRESEQFIADFFQQMPEKLQYVIVNEAGASVYSASALASEEFPALDVGARSAASIARRLQDPLAELVKIDPKSIGVGQYQHDMNQKRLAQTLDGVVESCVNAVGVDLNTASAPLLQKVSGISKTVAENIVRFREENGAFRNRSQLRKVPKLGPKAYEQCAGFLRIKDGDNPLDNTAVHPESYFAALNLLKELQLTPEDLKIGGAGRQLRTLRGSGDTAALAKRLGVGEPTLLDILSELEKPGRDPREELPRPVLRSDVLALEDLKEGMVLKGTVRNVIDFGAFVDIGVHQDGLVHISQLTDRKYVKHPLEVVSVGDVVWVRVLGVDPQKKRISLSMKGISPEHAH